MLGFFVYMFTVYILFSVTAHKTYTGFTSDLQRRVFEHNVSETKGFTLRYRPWIVIHSEVFNLKSEAMQREKYLKSGKGRGEIKLIVAQYLQNNN